MRRMQPPERRYLRNMTYNRTYPKRVWPNAAVAEQAATAQRSVRLPRCCPDRLLELRKGHDVAVDGRDAIDPQPERPHLLEQIRGEGRSPGARREGVGLDQDPLPRQ